MSSPFRSRLLPLILLSLLGTSSSSQGQISSNVTLTTDYIFRGVSQTLNEPAIQGGFDWAASSGFYVGVWGSNVDFGGDAQIELDGYLGFAKETASGFGWDVGFIHYDYPGETDINFDEVYFGVSYKMFSAKAYFTDDFAGADDDGTYIEFNVDIPIGSGFELGLHAGSSSFGDGVGLEDYIDYKAAVSRDFKQLGLELAFTDTDTDQFGEYGDSQVVFSISASH